MTVLLCSFPYTTTTWPWKCIFQLQRTDWGLSKRSRHELGQGVTLLAGSRRHKYFSTYRLIIMLSGSMTGFEDRLTSDKMECLKEGAVALRPVNWSSNWRGCSLQVSNQRKYFRCPYSERLEILEGPLPARHSAPLSGIDVNLSCTLWNGTWRSWPCRG